ncbi:MAG TPA: phenylacetate--CoA ligase, partial [Arenibacter sp.]|nr:phenylacetate--CoA ligase [Arenibacter sp.]
MIPEIEKASAEAIKQLQEQRLRELIEYITQNSAYYKRIFQEHNLLASDIKTLADLTKLPTTSKEDLQQYNDDFLCVDRHKIIDYVTTSGTLGEPVTFALTDNDLNRLAYNEAISFDCAGVTANDILQLTTTIDRRFMAGLAYFLGARELGAGIIRVGAGIPELQWDSILKFKPTYLIVVP